MGHGTYYNEIDTFAAEWLRNLIKKGLIPDGEVDTRSIADVVPSDLGRFRQHHFFAGIGGWAHALRLAGWPDDRPVWTGSCPCQPFSVAGKGKGTSDERHLWPEFHRLIRECKPAIVFGEQVASRAGREWFAGVRSDLERVGYGAAAADLCAASVGAPHIRQRLYWVAQDLGFADRAGWEPWLSSAKAAGYRHSVVAGGGGSFMADAESIGRRGRAHNEDARRREQPSADTRAGSGNVADADDARRQGRQLLPERTDELSPWSRGVEWRRGADGKERRVKSGVRLLVDGVPNRVGRLRGYGNAIVPQVAAEFIRAFAYA